MVPTAAPQLEPRECSLLEDVFARGAIPEEMLDDALRRSPPVRARLVQGGWLVAVPTPVGVAYVLGARAKALFGIRSTWVTRPELAARQLLLRRVDAVLRSWQWRRLEPGALNYPRYHRPDGCPAYLLADPRGLRSRTIRRILDRHRTELLREGAVLLVISATWKRLRRLAARSNGLLIVAPLPGTVSAPPQSD